MTEDEKLALECLKLAVARSPGQAREVAEKDYEWIKSKGAKPAGGKSESGSPSGLSTVQRAPGFKLTAEQLARLDPDEVKRMSES